METKKEKFSLYKKRLKTPLHGLCVGRHDTGAWRSKDMVR
jgi:hypothetical protein